MALTKEQFQQIREELDYCNKPLFFFDDDPDGLASFLLLYRYKREGKGIPVKSTPKVDDKFVRNVEEYQPDKVFIVDIPMVEQSFLDQVSMPVIWIDHHTPCKRSKVKYFNPRMNDPEDNPSTAVNCYFVVQQDLWIAMVGAVGDWQLPSFTAEFQKQYPDLLPKTVKKPEQALFQSKLGELVKIFAFILKGKASEIKKYVNILTRIQNPYEILEQKTAQGKFVYKKYQEINKLYATLLQKAKQAKTKDSFLIFKYPDDKMSFTKELSNELLFLHPEKLIIVGRVKSGEVKISLRSSKMKLNQILQKALEGLPESYGGGHEYACGAVVKEKDFEPFIANLRDLTKQ
ncbi:DHH family phosphoesterase [Candidatus Woesearchaeota archaeon]|nr:DHH family phosphoesterase [Candidatus Woesearchaeota archaeon]